MGQLGHLVLLASIVASCFSHTFPSIKPKSSMEPSEPDFPTEFMNELMASLSPEILEELFTPIILSESVLEDKYGDTETPCISLEDTQYYNIVKATDGNDYYVINNGTETCQRIVHYVCVAGSNDNKCEPIDAEKFYGYCCRQHKITRPLYVIPTPKSLLDVRNGHLYLKGTNDKYDDFSVVKKDVFMNSYCSCEQSMMSMKEDYSCPNPDSNMWT